ncbi:MAG: DAK2 domain-containing protein [Clostridia bacterium]|nr:DAK2 domain-containing protein [Clostridia bacterium]
MKDEKILNESSPAKIDGATYASMVVSAANSIHNQKEAINELNVFPVPDGDTGINMSMTMSPAAELADYSGSISECADKVASSLLRAARGNSGVILSLFFRGIAKGFAGKDSVDSVDILKAFDMGVSEAYKAVQHPTEGTILTVMRASVETALEKASNKDYEVDNLFDYMVEVAEHTLEETPEMLPVLKQANVVDAGGAGFVAILEGMRAALKHQPVEALDKTGAPAATAKKANFAEFETFDIEFPYCTECIVTKSEEYLGEGKVEAFHEFVLNAGNSAVFVEDTEIVKVHVHTKDPGSVLSEALRYGSLFTVKVENMQNQHTELIEKEEAAPVKTVRAPEKQYGFVSVTMGEGMKTLFADLGVDSFVLGGQTMNPSAEQLIEAVNETPSEIVYLLPNNSNICLVAEQVAKIVEDKRVIVVPSVSVPQGVAAMMNFSPDETPEENTANMIAALSSVKTLDITFAARDSTFDGQEIKGGQILGLVERKVKYVTDTREECMDMLIDHMGEASFVTLFYGSDVDSDDAERMADHLREKLGDDVEVASVCGGQPLYYYVISVE